ncbi:MAG: hypothetical protein E6J90_17790 [Deltaproteobacteria bacterium]|nr:MAG: hypothetical protein E6J90_17790 [Deltaproteobacteria bacterium]
MAREPLRHQLVPQRHALDDVGPAQRLGQLERARERHARCLHQVPPVGAERDEVVGQQRGLVVAQPRVADDRGQRAVPRQHLLDRRVEAVHPDQVQPVVEPRHAADEQLAVIADRSGGGVEPRHQARRAADRFLQHLRDSCKTCTRTLCAVRSACASTRRAVEHTVAVAHVTPSPGGPPCEVLRSLVRAGPN